jgi:hypothetical protein
MNILYCLCTFILYSNIIDMSLVNFIRIFSVNMFYVQWFCNLLDLLNEKNKLNSIQYPEL